MYFINPSWGNEMLDTAASLRNRVTEEHICPFSVSIYV